MKSNPISLDDIRNILGEDVYQVSLQYPPSVKAISMGAEYSIYNLDKLNVEKVVGFVESRGGIIIKQISFVNHKGQQKFTIWYKTSYVKKL